MERKRNIERETEICLDIKNRERERLIKRGRDGEDERDTVTENETSGEAEK